MEPGRVLVEEDAANVIGIEVEEEAHKWRHLLGGLLRPRSLLPRRRHLGGGCGFGRETTDEAKADGADCRLILIWTEIKLMCTEIKLCVVLAHNESMMSGVITRIVINCLHRATM